MVDVIKNLGTCNSEMKETEMVDVIKKIESRLYSSDEIKNAIVNQTDILNYMLNTYDGEETQFERRRN